MCGIVALWNRDGAPIDLGALERAVHAMSRRGPDDEGYLLIDSRTGRFISCRGAASDPRIDLPPLVSARGGAYDLALGHRRLSIVDLSPAGHQPMCGPAETTWIVFNGMIHNFLDLRRELEARGRVFRSRTDTEVILQAYDEWGHGCVERFNGMWAFVLWDGRRRRLFASRDRLGIKPLVWAVAGPVAAFASDIGALRAFPRIPREIDPEAVHHYLGLMQVPAPFTIYRAMRKVRPGHSMVVERDAVAAAQYWRLEPRAEPVASVAEALNDIEALLADSVRLRLIADVPTAALLSGGVDSGIITALAARQLGSETLRTFTLGVPEAPDIDETPTAERVADHIGSEHRTVPFPPDFLEMLPHLVVLLAEPFAVSSAVAVLLLAREASASSRILLTGDGGDEIFAGYLYRHQRVDDLWDTFVGRAWSRLRRQRVAAVTERIRWRSPSSTARFANRLRSAALSAQRGRDLCFNTKRTLFSEPEKRALYTPGWRRATRGMSTPDWLCESLPPPGGDRLARWQVHDVRTSLHDEMLTKVDRCTMAWGVEARPPLLDHRVVELAVRLPAALKLRDGEGKWILKKLGRRYLPADVLYRPKQGFTMPLSRWFAHEWRGLVAAALAPAALRRTGVFEPHVVAEVVAHHRAHPGFATAHMVYALLCFQIWHDAVHAG